MEENLFEGFHHIKIHAYRLEITQLNELFQPKQQQQNSILDEFQEYLSGLNGNFDNKPNPSLNFRIFLIQV
jgi:hypothetical protein